MFKILFLSLFINLGFGQDKKQQKEINIYFDFNKDSLTELAEKSLTDWQQNVDTTKQTIKIVAILGYTDSVGSAEYNYKLSVRRANSATAYLESLGAIIGEGVEIKGLGKDFKQDADPNKNRKVTLVYDVVPKPPKKKVVEKKVDTVKVVKKPKPVPVEPEFDPRTSNLNEKIKNAKVGDKIKLDDVNFYLNTYAVMPESGPKMRELLFVMQRNPKLKIDIQGHICCIANTNEKLSRDRAKKVFHYLIANGIDKSRLSFKGFGSTKPKFPLPEKDENEREANRRIEIQILAK